jgi:hypothetical protein
VLRVRMQTNYHQCEIRAGNNPHKYGSWSNLLDTVPYHRIQEIPSIKGTRKKKHC